MSSGDGWTTCAAGHRHWGLFGAAGLLLVGDGEVVLQHRAPWTHQGDTWGIPGGARDSHEDAVAAALREACEEAQLSAADIDPIGLYVDDHQGWSYTTVVARATRTVRPYAANAESVTVRWHPVAEVAGLPLHPGFASAWGRLQDVPPPLFLVVGDAAAGDPLLGQLRRTGVATDRLPVGPGRRWPHPAAAARGVRRRPGAQRRAATTPVAVRWCWRSSRQDLVPLA